MTDINATQDAVDLAEQNGVDLSTVTGTGKDGKIVVGDVRAVMAAAVGASLVKEPAAKVADPRQDAWNKYLADYEKKNPVKFATKKANGEFDVIPVSFKG